MKFFRTCYDEWVNLSLVKHFGIGFQNSSGGDEDYYFVTADNITLELFTVEIPPRDDTFWDENTDDARAKRQEWRDTCAYNRRKARAEACAWINELVDNLNKENAQ